jgi:pantetheine-phosphate adenylyltransferase
MLRKIWPRARAPFIANLGVMAKLAVYPGSFDPITLGHVDIIARAALLFDELEVLVVHNPDKAPRFSSSQRVSLIKDSLSEAGITSPNIKVTELSSGLLVDYLRQVDARVLLKGFRNNVDLDYELPMAKVNRDLSGIETVFIAADPAYGLVASSLVRQVAELGGPVENYVSQAVANALRSSK